MGKLTNRVATLHRPNHPQWVTLDGVIVPFENQLFLER
jgi:hypothetical protein